MIWSPISKYFLAGRWNILSLYDMKAYFKTFGLGAEIFSAYIIWKYIKTFGLSAQIFSVCVIWKYITQSSFFCRHLGWKYSRPVSSGTISKHLGLGTEIISACTSKYLCYWNIFQPVSSGSLSNMWWSWKWLCLHQDTTSFNLDPSILDGLYTVEIHVKVLIFLRHTLCLDAEVIKTEIMESNHVSKNHEMYKLFCLIWIRSFTSKAKTFD